MAGFVCTSPGQLFGTSSTREEQYLVLTATLYGQGENAATIKQRLTSLGYKNPATTVLTLAEQLQASQDPQVQRQAEALRQLSDALTVASDAAPPLPTSAASPSASTSASTPRSTPPSVTTPVTGASVPTPPDAMTTRTPGADQNPEAPVADAPPAGRIGTIQTSDADPALLRIGPNTAGTPRTAIPSGERVQILQVVTGQAIDEAENRWYLVKYGQLEGYVYSKLVIPGD